MAVEWGKPLETGILSLDTEHQDIILSINAFFEKCDEGGGVEELTGLYELLDGYTKRHFSYEENLQKYNNYPGLKEQQSQHALFLAELAELKNVLATSGPSKKLSITTKGKLIRWLNHHINSLDREFVDFLKTKQG
jgi:hemerythrin-like metal-binding protein